MARIFAVAFTAPTETRLHWNLLVYRLPSPTFPIRTAGTCELRICLSANSLAEQTRGKSILLANPPFENFEPDEMGGVREG